MTIRDTPELDRLKTEYRSLDRRVEELKGRAERDGLARAELERVTARKSEISHAIFRWVDEGEG